MKYHKLLSHFLGGLLLFMGVHAIPASAEMIILPRTEQPTETGLILNEDDTASFLVDGQKLTGSFSIMPDYIKGDISNDDSADAIDAALILSAAAQAGANPEKTAAEFLITDLLSTDYEILQTADINLDGFVNSEDAADILIYAAEKGAGKEMHPLGYASYQADENGILQKGWLDESHYAGENYQLYTGWHQIEGQQYYFSPEGDKQTGFVSIDQNHYYFEESGVLATGWIDAETGRMYADISGKILTDWQEIEDHTYYFDTDGIMQTGLVSMTDGIYYFNADGILSSGWIDAETGRMYADISGKILTDWQEIEDHTYYFDTDGIMQTGVVTIDNQTFRFQTDGIYHPRKICLDAGHYGSYYNHSPVNKNYYESNFTWAMHLYLKDALETYGFEVITTRQEKEIDLDLMDRGTMSAGCDLFLSIHSNYDNNYSLDYPLACCQISGVTDELGLQLATAIHEVMGTNQAAQIWKRHDTDERNGDWYTVLYGAASVGTPGILLEHSFHSNLRATNWLLNDANLILLAQAEAKVISDYFA